VSVEHSRAVSLIGPPYLFGASRRRPAAVVLQTVPERFGDYHESFLGGGARAIVVMQSHPDATYHLHGVSPALVAVWRALPVAVDEVVERVLEHVAGHSRAHFDEVRRQAGAGEAERAARFIYLSGSARGGGQAGAADDFASAQFGRDTVAFDEANVRALAALLGDRDVRVDARPLFDQLSAIREDDFVFLDPPSTHEEHAAGQPAAGAPPAGGPAAKLRELRSFVATVTARGAFLLLAENRSAGDIGGVASWNGVVRVGNDADGSDDAFWANGLLARALEAKR
jgi:site-specific DNA-adenine methylase